MRWRIPKLRWEILLVAWFGVSGAFGAALGNKSQAVQSVPVSHFAASAPISSPEPLYALTWSRTPVLPPEGPREPESTPDPTPEPTPEPTSEPTPEPAPEPEPQGSVPDRIRAEWARQGLSNGNEAVEVVRCESGNTFDPTIHSPSGKYHSMWQFALGTWANAHGIYDPHNATVEQQTSRAAEVYKRAGYSWRDWPYCGKRRFG